MCSYPCPCMWRCLCAHLAFETATVCVHPAKEFAGTWCGWSRSLHTQRQPVFAVHIFKWGLLYYLGMSVSKHMRPECIRGVCVCVCVRIMAL